MYLFVSTTAKHKSSILRLPDRELSNGKSLNYLITNEEYAVELFKQVDGLIPTVIIDAELKQDIDLFSIAKKYIKKSSIYMNKPNDLTMESADVLLQQHFDRELIGKKALIIGTGNISFKLALRLAERNVQVFIDGRNASKVTKVVETINMILPAYSKYKVKKFELNCFDGGLDAVIPFVSAEKVVPDSYAVLLHEFSISVDGGIGNFSEEYIAVALKKKSKVIRLDVRIALPFANASLKTLSPSFSFFENISGERMIENMNIVAGGIIGSEGTIIVDQIKNPQQIIGVANGYGGKT